MKVSVLKKDQDLNLFLRKNDKVTNKQGEQLLNPVWNRTRIIFQKQVSKSCRTGAETAPEQEQKHVPEQDQEQVPETGPGTVFVEEGQGLNQTEETHAKSCLE